MKEELEETINRLHAAVSQIDGSDQGPLTGDLAELWSALCMAERNSDRWAFVQNRALNRLAAAQRDNEILRRALVKIEAWEDFPPTEDFLPYHYHWGSKGEQDYMRSVAKDALAAAERERIDES